MLQLVAPVVCSSCAAVTIATIDEFQLDPSKCGILRLSHELYILDVLVMLSWTGRLCHQRSPCEGKMFTIIYAIFNNLTIILWIDEPAILVAVFGISVGGQIRTVNAIFIGVMLYPWACLLMEIGLSTLILGLWPMHQNWTYCCIIRAKPVGPVVQFLLLVAATAILVRWLIVGILGSDFAGVVYGFLAPVMTTFGAVGEGNEKPFIHCFVDGTWSTITGSNHVQLLSHELPAASDCMPSRRSAQSIVYIFWVLRHLFFSDGSMVRAVVYKHIIKLKLGGVDPSDEQMSSGSYMVITLYIFRYLTYMCWATEGGSNLDECAAKEFLPGTTFSTSRDQSSVSHGD